MIIELKFDLKKWIKKKNIVGKVENAGYQHTIFSKAFFLRVVESQYSVVKSSEFRIVVCNLFQFGRVRSEI